MAPISAKSGASAATGTDPADAGDRARLAVKLCGLSRPDHVTAALTAGADWLGFVIFPRSPRHVAPEALTALAAPASGRARRVAVLVNPDDALLDQVAPAVDALQLHGGETPSRTDAVRRRTGLEVWKSLPIAGAEDLDRVAPYEGMVDRLLFDAKPPAGADLPGGNGVAFQASLLNNARIPHPWILSGGLDAEGLADAVGQSNAQAVDVSSGIETAPGRKSAARMIAFMAAARTLECSNQ